MEGTIRTDGNTLLPTINFQMLQGDTVKSTKAGVNCNSSGQLEIWDAAGNINITSSVAGLVFSTVPMGAAVTSISKQVGGMSNITNATSGTVQNTEYAVNSLVVPANAFSANGKAMQVECFGTTAANANAKTIKLYLGATAIASFAGSPNGKAYHCRATIIRLAAASQICVSTLQVDTSVAPLMVVTATTEDETTALTVSVKTSNTAAAAASASGQGMVGFFIN